MLTESLLTLLRENGADLAGVGDMRGIDGCSYPVGIAVAVHLPAHIVRDLQQAPTEEYLKAYKTLNDTLNQIVLAGEKFLIQNGCRAYAQTTERVKTSGGAEWNAVLPHKTVATRAGLGWIGKNNLLVTEQYGPAVRLSSLLTDALLDCSEAIDSSRCDGCTVCRDACPGGTIHGKLWYPGLPREEIVDTKLCYQTQLRVMQTHTGIETDLCGKCFAVCPYTRKYLRGIFS